MIFDTLLSFLRRLSPKGGNPQAPVEPPIETKETNTLKEPASEKLRGAPIQARDALSFDQEVSNEVLNATARELNTPPKSSDIHYYTDKERKLIYEAHVVNNQKQKLTDVESDIPHIGRKPETKTPDKEREARINAKLNAAQDRLAELQLEKVQMRGKPKHGKGDINEIPPEHYPEQRL